MDCQDCIDQFGFKNILSLCPPYLGGCQEHDKRGVFQTIYVLLKFRNRCTPDLGHCIIILCHALGSPPGMANPTFLRLNLSIGCSVKLLARYRFLCFQRPIYHSRYLLKFQKVTYQVTFVSSLAPESTITSLLSSILYTGC